VQLYSVGLVVHCVGSVPEHHVPAAHGSQLMPAAPVFQSVM